MSIEVLDPTYGEGGAPFVGVERLSSLQGLTVGIVSNGKQGTTRFFDALATRLQTEYGVATVERVVKSNYSAPAGDEIMDATKTWNALISGIGD